MVNKCFRDTYLFRGLNSVHRNICSVMSDSLRPHGLQPTRLLCPRGFSRQEYWSGLPFPSPGDLSHSGIKRRSSTLQADSLPPETPGKPPSSDESIPNIAESHLCSQMAVLPTTGASPSFLKANLVQHNNH